MRRIDLVALPRRLRLRVEVPQTRRERMKGLLGRRELEPGRGLFLEHARSIHTFGMRFRLRAAFLDRELRVLYVRDVPPGRLVLARRGTRHILECGDSDLRSGDRLVPLAHEGADDHGEEGRRDREDGNEQHEPHP